jgi:glycosyltransferase involved in cell wall biosynthesis
MNASAGPADQPRPRLSIGLPVYNGERYLEAAIDSVLESSFTDWELIASDNASTDRTGEILQAYAARDPRIRVSRNDTNIGALPNFNRVVELSTAEYFKWLAYDDLCGPDLLARCIEVLDRDPSVVLCNSRFQEIDADGLVTRDQPYDVDLTSYAAHRRLGNLMETDAGHMILYGVIRMSVLRRTHLLALYHGSDRALLAELTLHGRLWEIQEPLWSSREHPGRSIYVRATVAGWDKPEGHRVPVHLQILAHMLRITLTAPLSIGERLRCVATLLLGVVGRWPTLLPTFGREVKDAIRTITRRPTG